MKIAVTGATGLIGRQVVRCALDAGHQVVAVTRPGSDRHPTFGALAGRRSVTARTAHLTDPAQLARALRGTDSLIHCAAVYAYGADRSDEVATVNVEGTRAVVKAAAAAGLAKIVVTGSAVTCGSNAKPQPRTEADHLAGEPAPAYYASKVAQQQAALQQAEAAGVALTLGLPTVVLGGRYGRLGPSNAIVLRYLLDPTRSTFSGGCNVVDCRDVGAGLLTLLDRGAAGESYILGGEDVTWRMLHTLVSDLAGLPGPFADAPRSAAWIASAAAEGWARLTSSAPLSTRDEASTVGRYYWYSSARANGIGYLARPARAAVAASLAWLTASGDVPRWVREGLRLAPEVRAARPLHPRPLDASDTR